MVIALAEIIGGYKLTLAMKIAGDYTTPLI